MDKEAFAEHLKWAEGLRLMPYRCSADKLTIGYGRNLEDNGISEEEAEFLLERDIQATLLQCRGLDYWDALDPVRQLVVADMVYNLGLTRFSRFVRFQAALRLGDYTLAAHEMQDSRWYTQVGRRAVRLQEAMRTGEWNV